MNQVDKTISANGWEFSMTRPMDLFSLPANA
jgi:hypothetical protein